MKFFVDELTDQWAHLERARELQRAIKEYNGRVTGNEKDGFSVAFPEGTPRNAIQEFIDAVQPRGVQIEESDVPLVCADAASRHAAIEELRAGTVECVGLPGDVHDILSNVGDAIWRVQDSEQARAVYDEMMNYTVDSELPVDLSPAAPDEWEAALAMTAEETAIERQLREQNERATLEAHRARRY